MRTYEEINANIIAATAINDAHALAALAEELTTIDSLQARAAEMSSRGHVYRLTSDYAKALECYRQVLDMYAALDDRANTGRTIGNIGSVFYFTGDYPNAVDHYHRAIEMFDGLGDLASVATFTGNLGAVCVLTGDYAKALEYFQQALVVHEELGDRISTARATGNIGNVYASVGDYPAALEHFRRALAMEEEVGDRAGVARLTGSMGMVYYATGDYPAALENFRRALDGYEEIGDRAGVARLIGNIGNVYKETGDHRKALEHLTTACTLQEQLGNRAGVASLTERIGNVRVALGDFSTALSDFQRALAMHEELGDRASIASATGNIISDLLRLQQDDQAEALLQKQAAMQLDDPTLRSQFHSNCAELAVHSGDLDTAYTELHQALSIAEHAGLRALCADIHLQLRDLAQKRNDFAAYIEHNNAHHRISDEVNGRESIQRIAMLEAERRMETERRERVKERALLYGALPVSVANRMLHSETISGDHFEEASVIFLDIAGFTAIADRIPPGHVVHLLSQIFSSLDQVCKRHGVTKIKTIGDCYMAVAGAPESYDDHASRAAACSIEMLSALSALTITMDPSIGDTSWTKEVGEINVRIGIHCGPLTAGVIGTERLQYDVWGDTVNVASRMESTGEPGRIQVSEAFASALSLVPSASREPRGADVDLAPGTWNLELRGEISIKGKGSMTTYWLS